MHCVRPRREETGVHDPGSGPVRFGHLPVRILVGETGGQELVLHAGQLSDDLIVHAAHSISAMAFAP
jgi:hypothetical protein